MISKLQQKQTSISQYLHNLPVVPATPVVPGTAGAAVLPGGTATVVVSENNLCKSANILKQ